MPYDASELAQNERIAADTFNRAREIEQALGIPHENAMNAAGMYAILDAHYRGETGALDPEGLVISGKELGKIVDQKLRRD